MTTATANARRLRKAERALFGTRSRFFSYVGRARTVRIPSAFRGLRWVSVAILVFFLVQVLTGALLALYYSPDPDAAYGSTRSLLSSVTAGWLVRSVHRWAADLLLVSAAIHLFVVFFRRAYAAPRQATWVVGAVLYLLFVGFRFTGRFLPMDEAGRDATQAGLSLMESVPLLGDLVASWLRGDPGVGAKMLSRFFATHVLLLPWVTFGLVAVHLWLLRRHGLRGDRR